MFKIFKDFPLNFNVLTWRLSQWVATVSFLVICWLGHDQVFGLFNGSQIKMFTPLAFVGFGAVIYMQLYTYGAYVNRKLDVVWIPAIVILVSTLMDLCFAYIMSNNLGYSPFYKIYFYRCGLLVIQCLIMWWVFMDVEFIEVPESSLDGADEILVETN